MRLLLLTTVIALCTRLLRSQLLSFPMNTIAKIGQRAELECSTNARYAVRWFFAEVNSIRFEPVYQLEEITSKFSSRYQVNTSVKGRWSLVMNSVDLDHAGTYRCQNAPDKNQRQTNASAQLIVIDSIPVCDTNASSGGLVEGDFFRMWCTINHSRNGFPVMEWTRNNGQMTDAQINRTYESRKFTSSLIRQLASSDHGAVFTCKITLNLNTSNDDSVNVDIPRATNIPHYQHSWNYVANVLYGPKKQALDLIDDPLKVGSRLKCFADGNPIPSYKWELIGKNIFITSGSEIVISESMEELTLRCTATNIVSGRMMSSEITFTFNLTHDTIILPTTQSTCSDCGEFQTNVIIVISVIALILLVLCLTMAVVIYKIRKAGNSIKSEKFHVQDYEMVDESNIKSADIGKAPQSKNKPKVESYSHENVDCEGYSSLKKLGSCAQPAVYAQLEQYANTKDN